MLSLAKQNELKDEILKERLDDILPPLMLECGIDAWIIASREYNEDPLFHALTPSRFVTARRTTILVLAMKDGKAERYCVNMHDDELERYYVQDYDAQKETQMEALTRVLQRLDAQKIAIDVSDHFAYTDGLSVGLYRQLMNELPKELTDRFVSSDDIGIRFLETRSPKELEIYPEVMKIAVEINEDTFSKERIVPGKTTCRDLMDYMEQRVNDLGIVTWFESTIDLQRADGMHGEGCVIERGDLLHCDFGIRYLNLCTDTQRLCYVSKEGETQIPAELVRAVERNHRFQDIVRSNMKIGASGNEVFVNSIEMAKKEGLRPVLYTHPLGFHGHAAGPTIGLFSNQHPIPVKGDLKLHDHTAYALELSIIEYLDCYQRDTYIFTEESVVLEGNEVSFLASGRNSIYMI